MDGYEWLFTMRDGEAAAELLKQVPHMDGSPQGPRRYPCRRPVAVVEAAVDGKGNRPPPDPNAPVCPKHRKPMNGRPSKFDEWLVLLRKDRLMTTGAGKPIFLQVHVVKTE